MTDIDTGRAREMATKVTAPAAAALVVALADALDEVRGERDRMIAARAEAIEKIPALRAKVAAGAALRPEIGAVDDEDAMALLIMAAVDVHGLWEREKGRTAELREALNLSRLAAEGWEKRAADAGLMVAQLRQAAERAADRLAEHARTGLSSDADEMASGVAEDLRLVLAATDPAAGR